MLNGASSTMPRQEQSQLLCSVLPLLLCDSEGVSAHGPSVSVHPLSSCRSQGCQQLTISSSFPSSASWWSLESLKNRTQFSMHEQLIPCKAGAKSKGNTMSRAMELG